MTRLATAIRTVSVAAVSLAILIGGTAFLHLRAAHTKADAAPTPMPVAAMPLEFSGGYDVVDRFVGRLEPAQQARLSFELGGLITALAVEEGEQVEPGQVIARLDTAILQAERSRLQGQRKQVIANLELAKLTAGRQRVLQRQGHASVQRLDETRLNVAALEGELAALDAAIRRVGIDIEKSTVRAPFAGTVGARFVDTGVVVAVGTAIIDLLESGRPRARIGVTPTAAASLSRGETVKLVSGQERLAGRIHAIRPDVSTSTRTVSVLIDLPGNPGINFGDTVELHLTRRVAAEGYWLPMSALSEGERGLWSVMTVLETGDGGYTVGRETVELIHMTDDRVFVRGTLRAGQRIIASGRNRVIPGQTVSLASLGEARP